MANNKKTRYIAVRHKGEWDSRSYEDYETAKDKNKGRNRIRINGNWRQVPKMKNDDVES